MWTCGNDSIMQLYNRYGKVVKSCQTKSGNKPWDIAVTRTGDLLYSDDKCCEEFADTGNDPI